MKSNIKYFIKHTLIYGISNIAQKASGVILVPLYTKYLSTSEYGQLGMLIISVTIISQALVLGQGQSILRYSNIEEYKDRRGDVFFTLASVIMMLALLLVIVGKSLLTTFADLFHDSSTFYNYLNISIYLAAFMLLNSFLMNKIRADEKSGLYTVSGVAKIIAIVAATIYLVPFKKMGVAGVLYSNLIGEVVGVVIITPYLLRLLTFRFDKNILVESLKFGFPLFFSALAMNLLTWSDRYVLKVLTNYAAIGLYELAYKVAGILNMFLIVPFSLTLLPIAYKFYKTEGDKLFYSKILTYFTFILCWAGLALSLFGNEIIHIFALDPSYYPAHQTVPVLTLAYVIFGVSLVTTLGLYLTGKTISVAVVTIFTVGLNIGLNFLLIPYWGIMAAAVNTLIAYIILVILTTMVSNKHYRIPYEYLRISKMIAIAVVLFLPAIFLLQMNLLINIFVKLLLIILYPLCLYLIKGIKKAEVLELQSMLNKYKPW